MEYPKNYIVWDLETTGFCPKENRITEIGVVVVHDGAIVKKKSWLLNYGIDIPEKITEITGITKEMIDKDGVDPKVALQEFFDLFVLGIPNVTHNGFKFDIPFIVESLSREGIDFDRMIFYNNMVDTAMLYKAQKLDIQIQSCETFFDFAKKVSSIWAKGVKYNIPLCCEEMNIDTSKITLHRALGDAMITNEIYKKICLI